MLGYAVIIASMVTCCNIILFKIMRIIVLSEFVALNKIFPSHR